MNYENEHWEKEDKEKLLKGTGIEYLHCSTAAYIYVEGKEVHDIGKDPYASSIDLQLLKVAEMSEKAWCDIRWFVHEFTYSINQWKWDNHSKERKNEDN